MSEDPLLSYRFWVEVDSRMVGGFSECGGLQAETEVFDWVEGGENTIVHKFPGRAQYANLILKHGMTDTLLWDWFTQVMKGEFERRPLTIRLTDALGEKVKVWNFNRAFPVKWTGPEFDAGGTTIALETVEFAHEGLVEI